MRFCFIIGLLIVLLSSCKKPEPKDLNIKLNEGDVIKCKISNITTKTLKIFTFKQSYVQGVHTVYDMEVRSIDESGNYHFDVFYDDVRVEVETFDMIDTLFNQIAGTDPSVNKFLPFLKGKSFQVVLAPNGSVVEISNADQIIKETIDTADVQDDSSFVSKFESARKVLGNNANKEHLEMFFKARPEVALTPFTKFERLIDIVRDGKNIEFKNKYRHKKSKNENEFIVTFQGETKNETSDKTFDLGYEGEQIGEIIIDKTSGIPQSGTITQNIVVKTKVNAQRFMRFSFSPLKTEKVLIYERINDNQ